MKMIPDVRPSPIAGQWYPANPRLLAKEVDGYLDAAELPPLDGEVVAVMAPHAGHRYSGPVAGYAFAAVRGQQPDCVAVISPMHYPVSPALLTTAHRAYATPLGTIPVDMEALAELGEKLQRTSARGLAPIANDPEHSLEIELPFLQRALAGPFHLLPVMVHEQNAEVARALGLALAQVLRARNALLVASTDLSHFYPQEMAQALDAALLRQVEAFDPAGVLEVELRGEGFACGRGALAAVLWAAQALGATRTRVLHWATSGDVSGDFERVVGYGAAAVLR